MKFKVKQLKKLIKEATLNDQELNQVLDDLYHQTESFHRVLLDREFLKQALKQDYETAQRWPNTNERQALVAGKTIQSFPKTSKEMMDTLMNSMNVDWKRSKSKKAKPSKTLTPEEFKQQHPDKWPSFIDHWADLGGVSDKEAEENLLENEFGTYEFRLENGKWEFYDSHSSDDSQGTWVPKENHWW